MPRRKNPSTGLNTAMALGGLALAGVAAYLYTRGGTTPKTATKAKSSTKVPSTDQPLPAGDGDCTTPVMVGGFYRYPTGEKDSEGQCIFEEPKSPSEPVTPAIPVMTVDEAIAEAIATYDDKALAADTNAFIDIVYQLMYPDGPVPINASAAHAKWRSAWLELGSPVEQAASQLRDLPEPTVSVDAAIQGAVADVQAQGLSPTLGELVDMVVGQMYPDTSTWPAALAESVFDYVTTIVERATNFLFGWMGPEKDPADTSDLLAILDAHKEFAESGGTKGKLADLRKRDLRGLKLDYAYLEGANLEGANLEGASLRQVDFRGANLRGVNLRDAKMFEVDASDADLIGASLRGADLRGANLSKADLTKAELIDANLTGAILVSSYFYNASLRGANLERSVLDGVDFTFADLEGASLLSAALLRGGATNVTAPNFNQANLGGADVRFATLRNANFREAVAVGALFEATDLSYAGFTAVDAAGADFTDANFSNAVLWDSDLRDAQLFGATFTGADLKGASFAGAQVNQSAFAGMQRSKYGLSDAQEDELVVVADEARA
jgi:uncharacterized protein YjbI with pentapeptide repeats